MAAHPHASPRTGPAERPRTVLARGHGWLTLAAVMLVLVAASNAAYGFAALAEDGRFQQDQLVIGALSLWGGFSLVFAAVQLGAAVLVVRGRPLGIVVAAIVAMLNGTAALVSIGAYPLWSAAVVVMDGLVIYGLSAHTAAARTTLDG